MPPLPHRARTFHQGAGRSRASRGRASAWTSLIDVVIIFKIIETDLVAVITFVACTDSTA